VSATEITVIGNVVTSPSRVRTQGGSVTNFRLASTERRYDGATQGFVDGATFFVDVECWGELGGNVSHSVSKGDPVVVRGVIRTDEWESDQGPRSRPRVRAEAVGPNLARGTADFRRTRRAAPAPAAEPPVADGAEERDYEGPLQPLYELDPETSAAAQALEHELGALPEPALQ
jgi:single-strand DNA-binding protein